MINTTLLRKIWENHGQIKYGKPLMQRFRILHQTDYHFSQFVSLGPHRLLFRPREDHELRIESFDLKISPPASLLWQRDIEGNSVVNATFSHATQYLSIESTAIIQQFNHQPLNFLVDDYALSYPFVYRTEDANILDPYRILPPKHTEQTVKDWITSFWNAGERIETYSLLNQMCLHISRTMMYAVREQPGLQSAEQTIIDGTGSCRDFASLFVEAARCLGLAARFVSGYLYVFTEPENGGATHAWAEVYLPGAGWKGFDPTGGIVAGQQHIAVAVAAAPERIPPVTGTFEGAADSVLETRVWVNQI